MDDLIPRGSETILFVDDEAYLADIGKEMLEDFGYVVESMTSSRQAFELFEQNPDKFDLVMTDYTMPQMKGDELGMKLQQINPKVPIIMCTGVSLDPKFPNGFAPDKIMMKPMGMEDMLKIVRDVLDKTSG